jgi:hypothetical protein
MLKRIFSFAGWSITSLLFCIGFVGVSQPGAALALVFWVWGLIFCPWVYRRWTGRFGWKRNFLARVVVFVVSPLLVAPFVGSAQTAQGVNAPRAAAVVKTPVAGSDRQASQAKDAGAAAQRDDGAKKEAAKAAAEKVERERVARAEAERAAKVEAERVAEKEAERQARTKEEERRVQAEVEASAELERQSRSAVRERPIQSELMREEPRRVTGRSPQVSETMPEEARVEAQTAEPSSSGGYIPGTCKDLKRMGLGRFTVGDPNYTSARDRDGDGIACE